MTTIFNINPKWNKNKTPYKIFISFMKGILFSNSLIYADTQIIHFNFENLESELIDCSFGC